MRVKLVVIGGKKTGMEIPITTPTFVIGRGEGCHLRPQCSFVNQIHCQISVDAKGSVAIDDSSGAVGTFVNGERIKWHTVLKHGDRIKVGTLELEVQYAAEEEVEKPSPATSVARRAVVPTAVSKEEVDILKWVEQAEEKEDDDKVEQKVAAVSTPPTAKHQVVSVAEEKRPRHPHEIEIEWEGADLLLATSIGILLIVVLCMVWPMIPWPHWHWHPPRWYWTLAIWYWTYTSWAKWVAIGFSAFVVSLFVWLRAH